MGDFVRANPLVLLIGGAEIAFWVFLLAGLVARYLLRWRRVSAGLLLCVPLVDVVLVAACLADLGTGGTPGRVHGLAALYLGFTVAFGHSMVRWVDVRFAHRFAGGPAPVKVPRGGPVRIRHEWREFGKMALAWGITLAVLALLSLVAGTGIPGPAAWPTDAMWSWAATASTVAGIWLVAGPVWATVFPSPEKDPRTERAGAR